MLSGAIHDHRERNKLRGREGRELGVREGKNRDLSLPLFCCCYSLFFMLLFGVFGIVEVIVAGVIGGIFDGVVAVNGIEGGELLQFFREGG